ncbi:MAG: hypothetical protein F4X09_11905 [Gammaproteobacteria bacterium]|nr:hypothetical protein [Gammaproteobacteria bacterium]
MALITEKAVRDRNQLAGNMFTSNVRYVAHIDILGMSTMVKGNLAEAWQMLSNLTDVKDIMVQSEINFLETAERVSLSDRIRAVAFSDTILLFTLNERSTDLDLRCLTVLTTEILHMAICRCVPVRAGIAKGEFLFDPIRSMYCGPALVDAYHAGEETQWIGITLHETAASDALALNLRTSESPVIIPYSVPIKRGSRDGHVINWPAIFSHDLIVEPPLTVENFYSPLARIFGPFDSLDSAVQEKYVNTVNFMNEQLADYDA